MSVWRADLGNGMYKNPILYADYSDPDIVKHGEDYYMVASSFTYVPGVPVLHSKDLVNWHLINYCVKELPFDRYTQPQHGCGTWAPAIRVHEGVFYVFIPMPDDVITSYSIHYTKLYESDQPGGPEVLHRHQHLPPCRKLTHFCKEK